MGFDPVTPLLWLATTLTIAAMSSTVDLVVLRAHLKRPYSMCVAVGCQYALLPLTAVGLVYLLNFDKVRAVALCVLATCPGGSLSNFFCFLCGADVNLSVACTAASTLLSVVFMPLNIFLYVTCIVDPNNSVHIDWVALIVTIALLFFGMTVGLSINYCIEKPKMRKAREWLIKTAIIIIAIACSYFAITSAIALIHTGPRYFCGIVMLSVSGALFGGLLSKACGLPLAGQIAVAIETSQQNASVGLVIMAVSIDDKGDEAKASALLVAYQAFAMAFLFVAALVSFRFKLIPRPEDNTLTLFVLIEQWRNRKQQVTEAEDNDSEEVDATEEEICE